MVERSDGLCVSVAGLRFVGYELLEHFRRYQQLVQAGVGRRRRHDRRGGHGVELGGQWSGESAATGVVTIPVQPPVNTSLPTISWSDRGWGHVDRVERVVVERSDRLQLSVAGLRFVGCELLEHFWRDQQLVQAGVGRRGRARSTWW